MGIFDIHAEAQQRLLLLQQNTEITDAVADVMDRLHISH